MFNKSAPNSFYLYAATIPIFVKPKNNLIASITNTTSLTKLNTCQGIKQ
jgi:hypothetical protein